MASSLGELFVELGVFADTKELKDFETKLRKVSKTMQETSNKNDKLQKGLNEFVHGLTAIVGAIAGATIALSKLTDSLVSNNQEFLNLTRTSDIALSTFQKWDNVGKMFGVRNAAQQIQNLNERLFELKLTGQGAQGFMLAGINPMGQDAEGIMEQLRSRVSGLDDTSASYLLRQMGLDPTMLHLLRLGRKEFEELGQTVRKYQLTDEQTKQIQKMNVQLQIAQIKLKYLKDRAILAIMPYFVKWMQSLTRVTEGLARFIKWINKGIKSMPALQKGIIGVAVAVGILRKALLLLNTNPIIASLSLILSGLYLIIDDITGYFQGKDSMLGLLLNFFDELDNKINSIDSPQWLKDLLYIVQHIDNISGAVTDIKNGNVKVKSSEIFGNIPQILTPKAGKSVKKAFGSLVNGISTGGAASLDPDNSGINEFLVTPNMNRNIENNKTSYDNRQINMTNTIHTTQTGETVVTELAYAQNYAFSFG